ncbi:MAG: CDP-alcohol phosphatidyltransferase family protein [bacterium]
MAAHLIVFGRVALAFVTIALFGTSFWGQLAAFLLTIVVISLDALDGFVARKRGTVSDLGALLDITGDRIVENIYWIFFAVGGTISIWVPIVVITRGFLTDTLRSLAFAEGKTPFGDKTMMRSPVTSFLVSSRFSRALYGFSKAIVFCWLGGLIALRGAMDRYGLELPPDLLRGLELGAQVLVWIVATLCVVRGLPVLWDGRFYLLEKRYPRAMRKDA